MLVVQPCRRDAGARLNNGRTQVGAPALRQKNSIRARRFGRAKDSTQIMRILDSIQDNQKAGRFRLLEDFFTVEGVHLGGIAEYSLVARAFRLPVQPGLLFE